MLSRIWGWGMAAALCAALWASPRSHATTLAPACEQEGVSILFGFAHELRSADQTARPRPRVDHKVRALESSGYWRRCGELRNRISHNLDLLKRLPPDRLDAYLKNANPSASLRDWERAVLNAQAPPVSTHDKCESEASLCKQDYEVMFKSFREIGGPEFYKATCEDINQDGKPLDRACDYLKNLKAEGIDDGTGGQAFLEKHATCKPLRQSCDEQRYGRMKVMLDDIYQRYTAQHTLEIPIGVRLDFSGLKDCIHKHKKQNEVPGFSFPNNPFADPDKFCRGIYNFLVAERNRKEASEPCPAGKRRDQLGDCVADMNQCTADNAKARREAGQKMIDSGKEMLAEETQTAQGTALIAAGEALVAWASSCEKSLSGGPDPNPNPGTCAEGEVLGQSGQCCKTSGGGADAVCAGSQESQGGGE